MRVFDFSLGVIAGLFLVYALTSVGAFYISVQHPIDHVASKDELKELSNKCFSVFADAWNRTY